MMGGLDGSVFLAIIAMAMATYITRIAGFYFIKILAIEGHLKAALNGLPPAMLMAVIAPTVLLTGPAETGAAVLTAICAALRLPLIVTLGVGVGSVVILRAFFSAYAG